MSEKRDDDDDDNGCVFCGSAAHLAWVVCADCGGADVPCDSCEGVGGGMECRRCNAERGDVAAREDE